MLRNREIRLLFGSWLAVTAVSCAGGCWRWGLPGLWCGAGCLVLGGLYALFTRYRYRQIAALCDYLAAVYAGGEPLDIRDNREGELSLLKNDIYKIVSILKRQTRQLGADKAYLAEALQNISHQLKTPLTSLFVMTDLLAEPDLPQERRETFLHSTTEQLGRIQWLVSALLRLARIDAAAVDFKKEDMALCALLQRSLTPLRIPAELAGVQLQLDCPPQLHWRGDLSWTAEVVGNIVKNCIEHTPAGGTVALSCRENPLHIALYIRDTGPGIDQADLGRLFERFYKGQGAGPESVGIGLAMAKAILQSQNADVTAGNWESGAVFTVKLYKQVV